MSNTRDESESTSAKAQIEDTHTNQQRDSEVSLVPPRPAISSPDHMSTHPAGTHVLIKGTCREGATVELFNSRDVKLGDAVVVENQWFFSRVWGTEPSDDFYNGMWLGWIGSGAGKMEFYAVQTVDGISSEPSAVSIFTVGRLVKSPIPVLKLPVDGAELPAAVGHAILGACEAGASVDLKIVDQGTDPRYLLDFFPEQGGVFFIDVSKKHGVSTFQVRQTAPGLLVSDYGPAVTVKYVESNYIVEGNPGSAEIYSDASASTKRPSAPTIETPTNGEFSFVERRYLRTGECEEGAIVELMMDDGRLSSVYVEGKSWYASAKYESVYHSYYSPTFRVRQSVNGSEFSDWSEWVTVTVGISPPLVLYLLMKPTLPSNVILVGVCDKDATVWVNANNGAILEKAVVKGTTWAYFGRWQPDLYLVKMKQTYLRFESEYTDVIELNVP